ncbi:MAG TPA: transcription termination/antitermination NusG family protein [Xanthobacteraceae bacterium]|nr:transcription termination/antitermination NusG family protein [Xanthobacteraceae bacterium]
MKGAGKRVGGGAVIGDELGWCVLRMDGRHTLRLAGTLAKDGFEVWTPIETKTVRVTRANLKREIILPIMPSYVFARIDRLIDLLDLSARRMTPHIGAISHASFSVMKSGEKIAIVVDHQLQSLRLLELKRSPKRRSTVIFGKGVEVRVKMEGGSFAGMTGVVRRSENGHTLVCFSDRLTVKMDTSLLDLSEICNAKSRNTGSAAQRAA